MQASFDLSELEAVALHFQQSIDGDLLPDSMEMKGLEFDQVSIFTFFPWVQSFFSLTL